MRTICNSLYILDGAAEVVKIPPVDIYEKVLEQWNIEIYITIFWNRSMFHWVALFI